MGKALYRKYRSKSLAEIVGQEHITRALSRALENGQLSHAYLFTGPRGVGKTSIARILAYDANELPYDDSGQHLDIIEIDAASNRRIDEVRDLREKVHIAPTSAKYKVYIIDEVHMLTREAFNALLKTLEEPPAHVLFILATTEAHKLPETIVSRTQHFAFKPLAGDKVISHLAAIAESEGISVTADALELIALHGGGSFRDSIGLLDQVKNFADKIDRKEVEQLLGIASSESVDKLLDAVQSRDAGSVVSNLQRMKDRGVEPSVLADQISQRLQQELITNTPVLPRNEILILLTRLIEVPASAKPLLSLEISLLEAVFSSESQTIDTPGPAKPSRSTEDKIKKPEPKADKPKSPGTATKPPKTTARSAAMPAKPARATGKFDLKLWPEVLGLVKQSNNTMYGVLRMAVPAYTDDTLTLGFRFPFHQKRASDNKNQRIIIDAIKSVTGTTVKIECVVTDNATPPQPPDNESVADNESNPKSQNSSSLTTISNIFGGAELLES